MLRAIGFFPAEPAASEKGRAGRSPMQPLATVDPRAWASVAPHYVDLARSP